MSQCSTSARCIPLRHTCRASVTRPLTRQQFASALIPAAAQPLRASRVTGRHAMHVCAAAATETKEETFTYQAEVRMLTLLQR